MRNEDTSNQMQTRRLALKWANIACIVEQDGRVNDSVD